MYQTVANDQQKGGRMIHSSAGKPRVNKTLQYALFGAAMCLALATLTSAGRAAPFICDDTGATAFNFTCGSDASTTDSTRTTAVGDAAFAQNVQGATALGQFAAGGNFSTAVGNFAHGGADNTTAIGPSAQAGAIGLSQGNNQTAVGQAATANGASSTAV